MNNKQKIKELIGPDNKSKNKKRINLYSLAELDRNQKCLNNDMHINLNERLEGKNLL